MNLAHITVDTPYRRLDLAAPADAPVADLLTMLVAAGGDRLADEAAAAGWAVRMADGASLSAGRTLADQGVRDGSVLYLVPAGQAWPELEYDTIADAVAATRRADLPWSPAFTRAAGVTGGWLACASGLAAVMRASSAAPIAAAVAAVLLAGAVLVARVGEDRRSGVLLAGPALPYVYAAALLAGGAPDAAGLVRAGVTTGAVATAAALAIGGFGIAEVALGTLALLGSAASAVLQVMSPRAVAGCALALVALGAAAIPPVAARLARLDAWYAGGLDGLAPAVRRTESVASGLVAAAGLAGACAAAELVPSGWGRGLAAAAAAILALRARAYTAVPSRLISLAAGAATALPLVVWAAQTGAVPAGLAGCAALAGATCVLAGTPHLRRVPLSRMARLVEVTALISVIPLLCGVLDLYSRAAALS